jgi:two-component system cell cycle response regulator CtrA
MLRKKLAQAGADNVIGTVWGRGYMLRDPASGHLAAAKAQTAAAPMLARAA